MCTQLVLLRGHSNDIPMDHVCAFGYNIQTMTVDAVQGLGHLHELRGFEMARGVKRDLKRLLTKLDRKV